VVSQAEHQLGTRTGPTGLDEAEVTSRDTGVDSEIELTQPSPGTPVAEKLTYLGCGHRSIVRMVPHRHDDLTGNEIARDMTRQVIATMT